LSSADLGKRILAQLRARNSIGANLVSTRLTAVVAGPTAGGVAIASVALPNRLVVDRVRFVPSRIGSRSTPLRLRVHVAETVGGRSVAGALVRGLGVPFDRLSGRPEVVTGADGWATITFRVLPTFELRRGNLVVVQVRARKPGGSVLAGVSTRRLISVRVA
jgi:hypothetical protein